MDSAVRDRMNALCALAAVEQDSKKLHVLCEEINHLLEESEQLITAKRPASPSQLRSVRQSCNVLPQEGQPAKSSRLAVYRVYRMPSED